MRADLARFLRLLVELVYFVHLQYSYHVSDFGRVYGNETGMMYEIATNGPIVCGLATPDEFA
jgi:hypothetical protein